MLSKTFCDLQKEEQSFEPNQMVEPYSLAEPNIWSVSYMCQKLFDAYCIKEI